MARWITIFLALRSAFAAVRTLPERIAVGECLDSEAGDVSLYRSKIVSSFPDPAVTAAEADVTSAALISVAYGNHFKVLTEELAKEQYVLTQCGATQPTDEEVDAVVSGTGYQRKHFTIPLQNVAAASTTLLSFLRRLGVEDRVAYADAYGVHGCWQKAISCGRTLEASWGNVTKMEEQLDSVEVAFMDCNSDCSNVRARSNAVHVPATKDSGNLHSAEYIKFLAAFFNLEELALGMFQDTVASYTGRQVSASAPVVAWIQWNGYYKRWELSQATYKLHLVTAAGGRNVDAAQLAQSVPSMAVEDAVAGNAGAGKTYYVPEGDDKWAAADALLSQMQDVDIVVDETYAPDPGAYNYDSFLATFNLTSQGTQKFLTGQKVLRVDRLYTSMGGLDWMESRIAYPDLAATGLARYVLGDASLAQSYWRNVALNEAAELVTMESCNQSLPTCDASYATPIGVTMEASKSIQSVPALLLGLAWWAM